MHTVKSTPDYQANFLNETEIPASAHADVLRLLLLATVADHTVNGVELDAVVRQCERLGVQDRSLLERLASPGGFFLRGELMDTYLNVEALRGFARQLGQQLGGPP